MKTKPSGFTLVELLVVIAIIGILMGLLIPAVNAARETARRNQCSTQIKNLSLAAIQYANAKGEMPGYVQSFGQFAGGLDPSDPGNTGVGAHKKVGTWAVALLPWLDAQPTYEHWSEDRYPIIHLNAPGAEYEATSSLTNGGAGFHTLAAPSLALMQCPSNPVAQGDNGTNSYIANTGMSLNGTRPASSPTAPSVDFATSQARANGVFNNKYNVVMSGSKFTHVGEGPKVRLDDFKDGAGNTILFSENVQAMPWHLAGTIDATDLALGDPSHTDIVFNVTAGSAGGASASEVLAARYINGMVWHYADEKAGDAVMASAWNQNGTGTAEQPSTLNSLWKINGGGTSVSQEIFNLQMSTANSPDLARPSSAHVDGVNAAMADGGTRFIPDSIDYRAYQALLTPRGKSSNVPWPEYVYSDEEN